MNNEPERKRSCLGFRTILNFIVLILAEILKIISKSLSWIISMEILNTIGEIIKGIIGFITNMLKIISDSLSWIRSMVILETIGGMIRGIIGFIIEMLKIIWRIIGSTIRGILDIFF